MNLHDLLPLVSVPYRLSNLLALPNSRRSNHVRVLIYHDLQPDLYPQFFSQLVFLSKSWTFISPATFESYLQGGLVLPSRSLLLTFDDGFKSNIDIAKHILAPLGITAIFFVVSDFIAQQTQTSARNFIANFIQPNSRPRELPQCWENMDLSDLKELLSYGHTIGAHTKTHQNLALTPPSRLTEEIVNSADNLEELLSTKIRHFAHPFGTYSSISSSSLDLISQRFEFIHTGLRGINSITHPSRVICRDAASLQDQMLNYYLYDDHYLRSLLEGAADLVYARKVRKLRRKLAVKPPLGHSKILPSVNYITTNRKSL